MDPAKDGDSEASYFGQARPSAHTDPAEAPTTSAIVTPATPIIEQPPTIGSPLHHARTAQDDRRGAQFYPLDRQQSAIRLRRLRGPLPSRLDFAAPNIPRQPVAGEPTRATNADRDGAVAGRRRSSSEPQRPTFPQNATTTGALPSVPEADSTLSLCVEPLQVAGPDDPRRGGFHRFLGRRHQTVTGPQAQAGIPADDCYDSRIVDFLDVVDPEVATLSSITNVQNSLFIPSLGRWVNRRPTYDLSQLPPIPGAFPESLEDLDKGKAVEEPQAGVVRSPSLSSVLSAPQYAILPDNATLEGWREEDIKLLNDYVRHMLHSRRSKMKQRLKAFGKYASKPLGFLVTLYATLITLFGLAWVLFLIGWIYVGDRQLYAIEVIDYVLVALFNLVGLGLAPWRAVDTWHMAYVAHYHRKTWKLRKKLLLPKLKDRNDLPTADTSGQSPDSEAGPQRQGSDSDEFYPVLSDKEQETLLRHQTALAKSHTFYKPHETQTHHAFPLRLLIAVVLLLDLHSVLQFALGLCTYMLPKHLRSTAATTTILCLSITTNATAGILISLGDRRTRKKDVLERLLKQDLTAEMMEKIRRDKEKEEKEAQSGGDDDKGLLSIGAPLIEKMRKSTDKRRSEEISRKDTPQAEKA
ncbi:hypothetical protein QBC34DRAFT_102096 [Podospora aff. communis PSN243]|uniref:Integral membrane protein n=1 Tax=Podospora aff. communis PSN243 TaxID=3040156 RepID=A0AAV9GJL5_9PEZI|nr:hypothetical protein QBC34DRAFT_102096 [Podospora aff. communis PSN243]